jgi:hypothetical protein
MNLSEKSAIISCNNMRELAKKETFFYESKMKTIFDLCSNKYYNQEDYLNRDNHGYLPSLNINNKSCIYKKPQDNNGDWLNQFNYDDIKYKFNQQTRNKFSGTSC